MVAVWQLIAREAMPEAVERKVETGQPHTPRFRKSDRLRAANPYPSRR